MVQFGLQAYAFKYVVRIQQDDYLIFLLSGLLPWIFIASSIEMCATVFIHQAPVFKSIVINPVSFVVAQVVDNFLVLVIGLLIGGSVLTGFSTVSILKLILLIPALIPIFIFTVSVAVLVAVYQVFFRDLRFVIAFAISSLYFVTPVIYPIDFVPAADRWIFAFNPIHQMILPFRSALFASEQIYAIDLACTMGISICFAALAALVWRRHANEVVFYV